jgi:PleD family two-component response regulator
MYKVFLSYEQLKQYLTILTDNYLLRYDEETQTLKITEKGVWFLQIYNEIVNVMSQDNNNRSRRREKEEDLTGIRIANRDDNNNDKPLARLLVVDDDFDIVEVLKIGLLNNRFLVDAFTNPEEALQSFRSNA